MLIEDIFEDVLVTWEELGMLVSTLETNKDTEIHDEVGRLDMQTVNAGVVELVFSDVLCENCCQLRRLDLRFIFLDKVYESVRYLVVILRLVVYTLIGCRVG